VPKKHQKQARKACEGWKMQEIADRVLGTQMPDITVGVPPQPFGVALARQGMSDFGGGY
jgi:hypothetical protein